MFDFTKCTIHIDADLYRLIYYQYVDVDVANNTAAHIEEG